MQSVHDFIAKDINGKDVPLSQFKGKYILIVNVASQCGFTSQYKGLEDLYRELQNQVVVLGFPCNQFGKQEPGDETEIKQFCTLNYDVTFPLFGKINVNGSEAHPLYQFLKGEAPGVLGTEAIKWNFTKFLVSEEGQVIKRFAPSDTPEKIKAEIKSL
jgi:glutathione peroxidase